MKPTHRSVRSTRSFRNLSIAAAVLVAGASLAAGTAAQASSSSPSTDSYGPLMTGRAYGVGISGTKILGITVADGASPDTGYVVTTSSSATTKPCGVIPAGIVTATLLCPLVRTDARAAKVTSSDSVATAHVGITGLPVIDATAINATATSNCEGSLGTTTIAYLKIGSTVVIAKPTPIAPNTKIDVGVVSVTLNEQVPAAQGNGLTVNAIHVRANVLGLVKTSVVVASGESRVDCDYSAPLD